MSKAYQADPNQLQAYAIEMLHEVRRNEAETRRHRRFYMNLARREGLTYEQIGNALGITRASAHAYINRATADLICCHHPLPTGAQCAGCGTFNADDEIAG